MCTGGGAFSSELFLNRAPFETYQYFIVWEIFCTFPTEKQMCSTWNDDDQGYIKGARPLCVIFYLYTVYSAKCFLASNRTDRVESVKLCSFSVQHNSFYQPEVVRRVGLPPESWPQVVVPLALELFLNPAHFDKYRHFICGQIFCAFFTEKKGVRNPER